MLPGDIILTEGVRTSWISRTIAAVTDSWATHVHLVVDDARNAVDARFPRVRRLNALQHLKTLRAQDRAALVLRYPGNLRPEELAALTTVAEDFVGRWYDVGQVLLFLLTKRFWNDGTGTLACSRLITAAYHHAGLQLFPPALLNRHFSAHPRRDEIARGWVTPADLLGAGLVVTEFHPSSRIPSAWDFLPGYLRTRVLQPEAFIRT